MREKIIGLLDELDERKLKLVYRFIKALIGWGKD